MVLRKSRAYLNLWLEFLSNCKCFISISIEYVWSVDQKRAKFSLKGSHPNLAGQYFNLTAYSNHLYFRGTINKVAKCDPCTCPLKTEWESSTHFTQVSKQ